MSSKKRKTSSNIWYICDICKLTLQVKDTVTHKEKLCLVDDKLLVHPYVKDEILHTTVDSLTLGENQFMKSIPMYKQNDYILMSVNAMQLIKVPINDPLIICLRNNTSIPFVKYVWPTSEKNLSVYFTKQVMSENSLVPSSSVTIQTLKKNVKVATQIIIQLETSFNAGNDVNFLEKLKHEKLGNIYCIGNRSCINLYGKLLIFTIVDFTHLENNAIEQSSEKNHNDQAEPQLFVTTQDTSWKLKGNTNFHIQRKIILKIGGLNETIKELEEVIALGLYNKKAIPSIHIIRGVLIFGPGGTGKTTLVEMLAQKFHVNIVKVEISQIFSKYMGEAERQLVKIFEKAELLSPAIILIDELDIICPKINSRNDQEKRIIATLSLLLDQLQSAEKPVLVFATTSRISDVHKSLRRPGRFGKEIEIYVPNANQRKDILKIHIEDIKHDMDDGSIKEIADLTHGFVGADLVSLVSKAALRHYSNNFGKVSLNDFHWALTKVKPSAMREVLIEVPNVKWCDIGGQEELKLKLRQAIEWPLKHGDSFKRLGIVPPRGLLMFGPPGCSKTMIAKALATESNLNFISVKGPELFSKWVGESEKAVREVFRRARKVAPSIVFFDELDAIGGERKTSSGGTSVEERVLAQLLTELDGVEALGNVTVVGATNRLDRIDPALLRPGRFDRIIYVPLPDEETRRQIFEIQFRKTPIAQDVTLDELVQKTAGFSGAEIVAVCHEAALKALEENLMASCVLRKHFLNALDIIFPRTPHSLLKIYDKYLNKLVLE